MAHVAVVGAGAIGSHLVGHLARMAGITRITIVDRDRYTSSNLQGQDIGTRDVGCAKVRAQARRLRRVQPALSVTPIHAAVETVPLAALRGAVILAALDSRRARMAVNQAAWRLGVPWIDAGIHADGQLARVRVYEPAGAEAACLECAWDEEDYRAVDQTYSCAAGDAAGATGAPSHLASLAAALQAAECEKVLRGDLTHALVGRDVLIDARHHRHAVTTYRRNPACRMPDHDGWHITALGGSPGRVRLDELLAHGSTLRGAGVSLAFGIAGQRLVTALRCESCETARPTWQTERAVRQRRPACSGCGRRLCVTGFELCDFVDAAEVPDAARAEALSRLGVRPHDVVTFRTPHLDAHFEVGPS